MTPPVSSVPVILEKTAARRMVWVDVARVAAAFEQALQAATADIAGWVLVSGNSDPKPAASP